jgi:hypothetical protein
MNDRRVADAASPNGFGAKRADLRQALLEAVDANESANDALRDYLQRNRGTTRAVVDQLLNGDHPWQVLPRNEAAHRRDGYVEVWRRFEDTRQEMRRLTILWAKRQFGVSYRSMGQRLGVSEQMAIKLGGQAAKAYPVTKQDSA